MKPILNYLSEARAELAKVVWPTRKQAVRLTWSVIVFSLALAVIIGGVDLAFNKGLQYLIFKGQL